MALIRKPRYETTKIPRFHIRFFIDPLDINWSNCQQKKHLNILLNFFMRFILIMILVFLTTPTAFIQIIKDNPLLQPLTTNLQFVQDPFFKFIFNSFLPPLVVLIINRLLITLIYLLSWLISAMGKSPASIVLPRQHSESSLLLLLYQHVGRTWIGYPCRLEFI